MVVENIISSTEILLVETLDDYSNKEVHFVRRMITIIMSYVTYRIH